jgi:hypothetical protein
VGGLGAGAAAEVISADDLAAAQPDRWAARQLACVSLSWLASRVLWRLRVLRRMQPKGDRGPQLMHHAAQLHSCSTSLASCSAGHSDPAAG